MISPLKTEAASSFETLLPIYEITCYNIPENNYSSNFRAYTAQMFTYGSFNASAQMLEQTNIKGEDMEEPATHLTTCISKSDNFSVSGYLYPNF